MKRTVDTANRPVECVPRLSALGVAQGAALAFRSPESSLRIGLAKAVSDCVGLAHSAFVFGSTARGTAGPDSDLDVVLVFDHLTQLCGVRLPHLPRVPVHEVRALPPDVTNVTIDHDACGRKLHLEVYSAKWIESLLTARHVGTHRTAAFDPGNRARKGAIGHFVTLRGRRIEFPRNVERSGSFLLFDDYEPGDEPQDVALRLEQEKLAYCLAIRDDLDLRSAITLSHRHIVASAGQVLGRRPAMPDLTHAFTRERKGMVVPLMFSAEEEAKARETYRALAADGEDGRQMPQTGLPNSLRVSVTNLCNLRCEYCHGEGHMAAADQRTHHMRLGDFARIATLWRDAGGTRIKYTGGEPFCSPHLAGYLAVASSLGLQQSITTNGHFLGRSSIEMLGQHQVELVVGLDTMAQGARSKMSPIGLTAGEVTRRILAAKHVGLRPSINCVLTPYSETSIMEDMVPWCVAHGVPLRVIEEDTVLSERTSAQCTAIVDLADRIGSRFGLSIAVDADLGDLAAMSGSRPVVRFFRSLCRSGNMRACRAHSLRVTPEGEALPCMHRSTRVHLARAQDLAHVLDVTGWCGRGSAASGISQRERLRCRSLVGPACSASASRGCARAALGCEQAGQCV